MRRFGLNLFAICLLAALSTRAAETNSSPDFKEVFELLQAHLAGASEVDLNQAAVEGLLNSLRGKVTLVGKEKAGAQTNAALLRKASVMENDIAYLRVGRVAESLSKEIAAHIKELAETNKLKGVALDLRFVEGDDYAAAAAVADLFVADAKPLLDWGSGSAKSVKKFDIINLPVAVLVNRETGEAAEALAGVLRATGAGLILGSRTAGSAMISEEFVLKSGHKIRVGTATVKLGDGTALSAQGLKPDIEVAVKPEEERLYLEDAYASSASTNLIAGLGSPTNRLEGTNRPARRARPTEADLVRARREGINFDLDSALVRETEPEKQLIRDPALARAVDLLKGLAVLRQSRP